jgi:hypothetical protein
MGRQNGCSRRGLPCRRQPIRLPELGTARVTRHCEVEFQPRVGDGAGDELIERRDNLVHNADARNGLRQEAAIDGPATVMGSRCNATGRDPNGLSSLWAKVT